LLETKAMALSKMNAGLFIESVLSFTKKISRYYTQYLPYNNMWFG